MNLDAAPDDHSVWVHGQALPLPTGQWPAGQTPRAVLRLAGPVQPACRNSLARTGLAVQFWCPPTGVCVDMPRPYRKAPAHLSELGFVLAGADYTEAMCQRFAVADQALPPSVLPQDLFDIICFHRSVTKAARQALVKLGAEVLHTGTSKLRVRFAGDPALLRDVHDVKLVDVVRLPVLLSAAELRLSVGAQATPPGSWGLDGQGEVIAVADTGLDSGDAQQAMHPDFAGRIKALISLPMNTTWAGFAQPRTDDAADRASGHGTHVAGLRGQQRRAWRPGARCATGVPGDGATSGHAARRAGQPAVWLLPGRAAC